MSINSVTIIGNLTRDPETREVGDTSVTSLRVAVNTRQKQGDEWGEKPNYFDVTVWGKQGENAARFLSKGRPVGVHGRLDWREYEVDGQTRQAIQIIADEVQFLGGKHDDEGSNAGTDGTGEPETRTSAF